MTAHIYAAVRAFLAREDGPTMVEYALMLALIAIASLAVITSLGSEISTVFGTLKDSLAAVI